MIIIFMFFIDFVIFTIYVIRINRSILKIFCIVGKYIFSSVLSFIWKIIKINVGFLLYVY